MGEKITFSLLFLASTISFSGSVLTNLFDNTVTFTHKDGTLEFPTFEAENASDIWFQFRTTVSDGVMIHCVGSNVTDFVEIRLFHADTIQFRYDVGNVVTMVSYKSPSPLNDDTWHSVHVEMNQNQAWMKIDDYAGNATSEDPGLIHQLDLTSPLTVGALVGYGDGYVGCMRGLHVNGHLMDMLGKVRNQEVYGVQAGCVGKCASSPCFNLGICREGYDRYTCDCANTSWRGWNCDQDVGVNLKSNYMIRYTFDETQSLSVSDFQRATIGFSTKLKQGILMQMRNEQNTKYITVGMNNNGGVKVAMDVGFERVEVNTPSYMGIDYANGQTHVVVVERSDFGAKLTVTVDNYPPGYGYFSDTSKSSDTILNNPKYLFIGNNDTSNTKRGFDGCVFHMQIDNIFPLKDAFQDPRPSYIELTPADKVKESMCGFEETTVFPETVKTQPFTEALQNVTHSGVTAPPLTDNEKALVGDVGINLKSNYMIRYTFDETKSLSVSDFQRATIGFSTKLKQGILMQMRNEQNTEYITVEMNNNGGVKVAMDVGFERVEVNTPSYMGIDYANGQTHVVVVERSNFDRKLTVTVDNYAPGIGIFGYASKASDTILDNPKYLFIGNNDTSNTKRGFDGCIFHMQIDNIFPLKDAFQYPRPSYIELTPADKVKEGMCGFEETTVFPETVKTQPFTEALQNVTHSGVTAPHLTDNEKALVGDVGVNLKSNYMIRYTFDETQGHSVSDFQRATIGFSTKLKQGILMQLRNEQNTEYITVEMNNNGGVKVAMDVGFERVEVNTPVYMGIDYANGQAHVVVMERSNFGRKLTVTVDNYPPGIGIFGDASKTSDTILDNPKYLFIGNNDTSNTKRGFDGCIFHMQIDNIFPLKDAFQDPRPSYITLIPADKVKEGTCGFEETTVSPETVKTQPFTEALHTPVSSAVCTVRAMLPYTQVTLALTYVLHQARV